MPAISTCPRCQKSVSIPAGIDSDAMVRCPLCNAEYPLGEALPPELIPVLVPKVERSNPAAEAEDDTITDDTITIPLEPGDELVESAEADDQLTIEPFSTEEPSSDEAEADTYGIAQHLGDEEVEEDDEEQNEAVAMVGRVPKTAARPRRRRKSGLQTLIEVVTGGVAGCLVAYYGLAFFLGPELKNKGFPIYTFLPGIERLTKPAEKVNGSGENEKGPADTLVNPKPTDTPTPKPADMSPTPKPADTPTPKPADMSPTNPKPADGQAAAKTADLPKEPIEPSGEPKPDNSDVKKADLPEEQPEPSLEPSAEPASVEPSADEPSADELSADEPAPNEPAPNEPAPNEAASKTSAPTPEVSEVKKEPQPLRPQLGTAEYVGPRTPKSTTSAQLGAALEEVAAKADDVASPDAYESLCRLGETIAFINGDATDTQLTDRIAAAKAVLDAIAKQPEVWEKIAKKADVRIDADVGQNVGVLLPGAVTNLAKQNGIHGAIVELAGQSKTVTVLSSQDSELQVGDKVVVLGIVVREPSASLVGYSGSKSEVVWAAMLVKTP